MDENSNFETSSLALSKQKQLASSSPRFYHNATHVANLLTLFSKYESLIYHKNPFQLVIIFHDLVYNVKRKDNEAASSREFLVWSGGVTDGSLTDQDIQWVKRTIDATAHHLRYAKMWYERVREIRREIEEARVRMRHLDNVSLARSDNTDDDTIGKIQRLTDTLREHEDSLRFLDMDLEVLQWERQRYEEYATQIAQEYAVLFDGDMSQYRKGRLTFLQSFLKEDRFYYSDLGDETWERRARANLEWEREKLLAEDLERNAL